LAAFCNSFDCTLERFDETSGIGEYSCAYLHRVCYASDSEFPNQNPLLGLKLLM